MKISEKQIREMIKEEIVKSRSKTLIKESSMPKREVTQKMVKEIFNKSDDIKKGLKEGKLTKREAVEISCARAVNMLYVEMKNKMLSEEYINGMVEDL